MTLQHAISSSCVFAKKNSAALQKKFSCKKLDLNARNCNFGRWKVFEVRTHLRGMLWKLLSSHLQNLDPINSATNRSFDRWAKVGSLSLSLNRNSNLLQNFYFILEIRQNGSIMSCSQFSEHHLYFSKRTAKKFRSIKILVW